jgi:hypothetical protein
MVDRKSRALPDEVLTRWWRGSHVQLGRVKVLVDNYTTGANTLRVTPRMCRWCMCVSLGVRNLRWLVLVVELVHGRKLVPIYPPRPSPQVTRELDPADRCVATVKFFSCHRHTRPRRANSRVACGDARGG